MTADARSGDIINIENATNINRDMENRLVEGGPRGLVAVLLLKKVSGRHGHFGTHDSRGDKRCNLMEPGKRWQPGSGHMYWAHGHRRLHGRDHVDEFGE